MVLLKRTLIRPKVRRYQGTGLISHDIKAVRKASDWLIKNLDVVKHVSLGSNDSILRLLPKSTPS